MNGNNRANQWVWFHLLLALALCQTASATETPRSGQPEILWDRWGIPHVFAQNEEDAYYAVGWAHMQAHANAILRVYGHARGAAAEYWGETFLDSDKLVHALEIPTRARLWDEKKKETAAGRFLRAYVDGMNAYASAHLDIVKNENREVLPVQTADVLAHALRLLDVKFQNLDTVANIPSGPAGSNAWAVGPSHSASGSALLLANPHLPWRVPEMRLFEIQITSPENSTYGVSFIGIPIIVIGFNDRLGWTQTVNNVDAADLYQLQLSNTGYEWEGGARQFDTRTVTLKVKQKDGTKQDVDLRLRSSVHGPVIKDNKEGVFALRMAGADNEYLLEQYWEMARAKDRGQFEDAVRRQQLPFFNIIYADAKGEILFIFNGDVPVRSKGDYNFWQGAVPGSREDTLWKRTYSYDELPRLANPSSGWLQNTNDPPWSVTFPQVLKRENYPEYLNPVGMDMRSQYSAKTLINSAALSMEDLERVRFSTRVEMADRLMDDILAAARRIGTESSLRSAKILEDWDRTTEAASKGSVLFYRWATTMRAGGYREPWSEKDPLNTPDGLKDEEAAIKALDKVAGELEKNYGDPGVAWGDVFRIKIGDVNIPSYGGPGWLGNFHSMYYAPERDSRQFSASSGDSFSAVIQFSKPIKARALLVYGNSSEPGFPHASDQLKLYSEKKLRNVLFDRAELVEANLSSKESLMR